MGGVAVMIRDKYAVRLAPEQREELQNLIRVGKSSARVTARARILLKSDGSWAAPKVAEALDVALGTVYVNGGDKVGHWGGVKLYHLA